MKRLVEGKDRRQGVLLPEYLDDFVSEENPVRVIDVFVEGLDLGALGFAGVVPEATGRPGYHPSGPLKIYVYGYINQIASCTRVGDEEGSVALSKWRRCRSSKGDARVGKAHRRRGISMR
jgi:transposase